MAGKTNKKEIRDLIRKFESKIESQLITESAGASNYSQEYRRFKKETLAPLSTYERLCKNFGRIIKLRLKEKDRKRVERSLKAAHLDIEPGEAAGLAIFTLIISLIIIILISFSVLLFKNVFPILFFFLFIFAALFLFYFLNSLPARIEQRWRLKTSSQMVPCILYIVVYMRHTSNLERAIHFASQHLQPPLGLDLKKIFWDVETGKFSTIKDALDNYLESWRHYSLEFVEAFHLIESSLYETSKTRRMGTLEKALEVMLDGVYEKMLHYTHEIKSPITNIYMLGIVLPTLGLALLPLASTLLQGAIQWYHVAILFNLLIPFLVFYMTNNVLAKRPGGFGETELLERNPNYHYYKSKKPYLKALLIVLPLIIIGLLPFIIYYGGSVLGTQQDYTLNELGLGIFERLGFEIGDQKIFDFKVDPDTNATVGPFGPVALVLSLCIPLAVALFFALAFKFKTQPLIATRKQTKRLEKEFASSIFQLGNRLADGIPAEMAFGRVASALRGTPTAGFFNLVNSNIQQVGMGVKEAVFNKRRGALIYYPSELIRTSMRIMVESLKKGLDTAARALMAISTYVKNIHKVNERLRDLLADITSGMKSNMTFLAPLLASIVVGLASMITMILGRLQSMIALGDLEMGQTVAGFGTIGTITEMFNVVKMIPPYWLQIIVGIYIVEIIFILTSTLVTIESGEDRLGEKSETSKALFTGMGLYTAAALIAIVALAVLAVVAVGGMV